MSAKRDYYEVLGVSQDADKNTIKKAYRKLAKKYHPDTNQGNAQAAERFKEATEAYNILSDPEKKKMYDQFGHAAFDGSGAAGGAYGGAYTMEKHNEIITIVDKTEYQKLMKYINQVDPKAFITIYKVSNMRYQPKI